MSGTVYVVDDDAGVRHSVGYLMESVGLETVAFSSAREFLSVFREGGPACLVLDLRMPEVSGLETQELIRKKNIRIPTIIMTGHGDVPAAVRAMKLGAVDFLEKPCNDHVLLDRVQKAIEQDRQRIAAEARRSDRLNVLNKLSNREREVMTLVVAGHSNKETAQQLGVSPKTIETHRANLMRKLDISSFAELVQLAMSSDHQGDSI